MKKNLLFGLIMSGLVFAGCKESQTDKFLGNWKVESFEIDGVAKNVEESGFSLSQKSENLLDITGNSGVNSFFGQVEVKNNGFVVDDKMASTKMAGSPEAMEYEDNFLACLTGADNFDVEEKDGIKTLKISNSKNNMVIKLIPAEDNM